MYMCMILCVLWVCVIMCLCALHVSGHTGVCMYGGLRATVLCTQEPLQMEIPLGDDGSPAAQARCTAWQDAHRGRSWTLRKGAGVLGFFSPEKCSGKQTGETPPPSAGRGLGLHTRTAPLQSWGYSWQERYEKPGLRDSHKAVHSCTGGPWRRHQ